MPWKETCALGQRVQFIADWLSGNYTKMRLCQMYGISRPTGDKWIRRYQELGELGFAERSRAPQTHPNAVPEAVRARILEAKRAHPYWGPRKVLAWLRNQDPAVRWPAVSTAGELLRRAGLVRARRVRRRVPPDTAPFAVYTQPGQSWSADFKGDFALANGVRCHPLTITDNVSRYLLACRALTRTGTALVRPWFEQVFRCHGLPQAMRTDNGPPFASRALGGLSPLARWWIELGIRPERIRPGKPAQNARHERMHRSLDEAAISPWQHTIDAQQRRFDAFRAEFNSERPHEALGERTPAQCHAPCPRPYPSTVPEVSYDDHVQVRRVRPNGEIKWHGRLLYLSEVLAKAPVGIIPVDYGIWELRYSFHLLGYFDEHTGKLRPAPRWHQPAAQPCKPCARSDV